MEVSAKDKGGALARCGIRPILFVFGWLNVAMGVIGVIVPGLPTTIFLLIAVWAFSRSSERFQMWLYNHRTLGKPIRDWHAHGVIPVKAKLLAIGMMNASLIILSVYVADDHVLPLIVGAVMVPVAAFIVSRPSRPNTASSPALLTPSH